MHYGRVVLNLTISDRCVSFMLHRQYLCETNADHRVAESNYRQRYAELHQENDGACKYVSVREYPMIRWGKRRGR
jgi:hypothetical protein